MEGSHSASSFPRMGRDSAWLAGADIVAVFLALFGQVVLTRALWTESYGLFIIALDVFATLFLAADLGLPTLSIATAPMRLIEFGRQSSGFTICRFEQQFPFVCVFDCRRIC